MADEEMNVIEVPLGSDLDEDTQPNNMGVELQASFEQLVEEVTAMFAIAEDSAAGRHFHVIAKGGTFDRFRRGGARHVISCVKAFAVTQDAKDFCEMSTLPLTASFTVAKYGDTESFVMAREWQFKLSYCYGVYVCMKDAEFLGAWPPFDEGDIDDYNETEQFMNMMDFYPEGHPVKVRGGALRRLAPLDPVP